MNRPEELQTIFASYTEEIDVSLHTLFASLPAVPLYDHLSYFMGFKNEQLKPEVVYGGKRIRSALMLLLADFYGDKAAGAAGALSLELFHNFTLIHDDIVDGDIMRRGRPTVWKLFGTDHAINSGDAQFILATEALARDDNKYSRELMEFMLAQYRLVIEGQYHDFFLTDAPLGHEDVTEEHYHLMIERKTAVLIAAGTQGAGIATGQSEAEQALLRTYALELGNAYQICDDVVSAWATTEQTGKENYGDIRERKKTLPILYAYQSLDEKGRSELESFFARTERLSEAEALAILKLMDSVGTHEAMRVVIDEKAAAAKAAANALALTSEQKETLVTIVDALLPEVK